MMKIYPNLMRLRQSNFCSPRFSALVIDERRLDVVKLEPVSIRDLLGVIIDVEAILRVCVNFIVKERPAWRSRIGRDGSVTEQILRRNSDP